MSYKPSVVAKTYDTATEINGYHAGEHRRLLLPLRDAIRQLRAHEQARGFQYEYTLEKPESCLVRMEVRVRDGCSNPKHALLVFMRQMDSSVDALNSYGFLMTRQEPTWYKNGSMAAERLELWFYDITYPYPSKHYTASASNRLLLNIEHHSDHGNSIGFCELAISKSGSRLLNFDLVLIPEEIDKQHLILRTIRIRNIRQRASMFNFTVRRNLEENTVEVVKAGYAFGEVHLKHFSSTAMNKFARTMESFGALVREETVGKRKEPEKLVLSPAPW